MSTANESTPILLISSDYSHHTLSPSAAQQSLLLADLIADLGPSAAAAGVPLPNVSGAVLSHIVRWCELHAGDPVPTSTSTSTSPPNPQQSGPDDYDHDAWAERSRASSLSGPDRAFLSSVGGPSALCEVVAGANYLAVGRLAEAGCRAVAEALRGRTAAQMRDVLGVENDFAPGEEERVRGAYGWAVDGDGDGEEGGMDWEE